uniref:Aminotransferase-like plant mobile domain-containing protein n=1 Tax=Ananas comosus var. bracteatus TaxID=296719 RepID=A0A6V7PAT9_ANACO|nr:unnamed protein product [Ananas comosus var. bracteatus]
MDEDDEEEILVEERDEVEFLPISNPNEEAPPSERASSSTQTPKTLALDPRSSLLGTKLSPLTPSRRLEAIGEGAAAGEYKDLEVKMTEERLRFNRSSSKKAHHSAWMRHFIEHDADDLEHIAFLSLWLSRFVFCSHPEKTVKQNVFSIAIRLARGVRVALAPAVLAVIYRDLRELKDYMVYSGGRKDIPLVLWAPLEILQLWVWERFPALRPEAEKLIEAGEPRAARWHDVGKKSELSFVNSIIKNPNEFRWRPYAADLSNWCKPDFYKDNGEWVRGESVRDEGLNSFAKCLRVCELVALDCIERYLPHRVAMQFGLDQDIPHSISRANSRWEEAWSTYEIGKKNLAVYCPSRSSDSGITIEYLKWWKECMANCGTYAVSSEEKSQNLLENAKRSSEEAMEEEKKASKKKARVSPNGKKRKLVDFYNTTLSDWLAFTDQYIGGNKYLNSEKPSLVKEGLDNSNNPNVERVMQIGEALSIEGEKLRKTNEEIVEDDKEKVIVETIKEHKEDVLLKEANPRGESKEIMVSDVEGKAIVDEDKRKDNGESTKEIVEVVPLEQGNQKEENKDEEVKMIAENVKEIKGEESSYDSVVKNELNEAPSQEEPNQSSVKEAEEIANTEDGEKKNENKGISDDKSVEEQVVRDVNIGNDGESTTVVKESQEALSPGKACQREEDKGISDEDQDANRTIKGEPPLDPDITKAATPLESEGKGRIVEIKRKSIPPHEFDSLDKEDRAKMIEIEEGEGVFSPQVAKLRMEKIEERRASRIAKESELEMQIRKLKEEITAMEARVMDLEPINEVHFSS